MKTPFGYRYVRCDYDGEEYLRPSMVILAGMLEKWWGFKLIAKISDSTVLVQSPFVLDMDRSVKPPYQSYTWWTLCDNGGEISVRAVNFEKTRTDPPYVQHGMKVPMGRLAWFCAMTMKNEPIDWNYTGVDDIDLAA